VELEEALVLSPDLAGVHHVEPGLLGEPRLADEVAGPYSSQDKK
jgi:hypothetical protein